jgi:steroid 5-alpha reductase family enzyme
LSALILALPVLAALCAAFALLFALARRIDNYGIVDIGWSYAFGAAALAFEAAGPGWFVRRVLIGSMVVLWSARLGTHLLIRIAAHHPREDGRYRQLRRDWQSEFRFKMAGFFQLQAASVVLLSIPFMAPAFNAARGLGPLEWTGAALWLVGIAGEAMSDAQLAAFKRDSSTAGKVCSAGLWGFSRHPNYFFEWLVWVGYFVFACGSPWGWLGIISPAIILGLLLRVTGIPTTEEQLLRSKGEAYRAYQRTTSAFIPWFPRRGR